MPRARHGRALAVREWLGNPLVVAVVSTVLAALVIPQLTRQWQDHQKALEIQTRLVSSMSETSSDAIISARLLASRGPSAGAQTTLEQATRSWAVQSSSIGSELQAYFPDSDIGSRWRMYADGVTDYVQLYATVDRYRPLVVEQIRALGLPRTTPPVRWNVLARENAGDAFVQSYTLLAFALLDRRDELVSDVLAARPSGY